MEGLWTISRKEYTVSAQTEITQYIVELFDKRTPASEAAWHPTTFNARHDSLADAKARAQSCSTVFFKRRIIEETITRRVLIED